MIEDFVSVMNVLYPNEESFSLFKDLLHKYKPTGFQIHDYEILSIGLSNQITAVATFNEKDFKDVDEIKLHRF